MSIYSYNEKQKDIEMKSHVLYFYIDELCIFQKLTSTSTEVSFQWQVLFDLISLENVVDIFWLFECKTHTEKVRMNEKQRHFTLCSDLIVLPI